MNHVLDCQVDWAGIRRASTISGFSVSKIQRLVIENKIRTINPPDRASKLYSVIDLLSLSEKTREMMATV